MRGEEKGGGQVKGKELAQVCTRYSYFVGDWVAVGPAPGAKLAATFCLQLYFPSSNWVTNGKAHGIVHT